MRKTPTNKAMIAKSPMQSPSKTSLQDFLTLWKDADPEIPVLQQANAEYVKSP